MPKQTLNKIYHALSDQTRRKVLEALAYGPMSVSGLARQHKMALSSFIQHLDVLETAGLIVTQKRGRVRYCSLIRAPLEEAEAWLDAQKLAAWQYMQNPVTYSEIIGPAPAKEN